VLRNDLHIMRVKETSREHKIEELQKIVKEKQSVIEHLSKQVDSLSKKEKYLTNATGKCFV
jgi:uncharacterized coiled-coil protein SlyX